MHFFHLKIKGFQETRYHIALKQLSVVLRISFCLTLIASRQ